MCQAMTLADDAFQWAVYEIWKMGNRGLFCHASRISKMSFCNLNRGAERGDLHHLTLTIHRPGRDFAYNETPFSHFLLSDNHPSFLSSTHLPSFLPSEPSCFFLSFINVFHYSRICVFTQQRNHNFHTLYTF